MRCDSIEFFQLKVRAECVRQAAPATMIPEHINFSRHGSGMAACRTLPARIRLQTHTTPIKPDTRTKLNSSLNFKPFWIVFWGHMRKFNL